jgi:hypothetical protein
MAKDIQKTVLNNKLYKGIWKIIKFFFVEKKENVNREK